jgi:hypothetical protein
MNYRINRPTYKESLNIVAGLFNSALNEFQFQSGQAWAYALDEIELLRNHDDPKENIIILTAVYKIALLNNVELSGDDDYTSDMIDDLKNAYRQFDECIFNGLDMNESEVSSLKSDMQLISDKYLSR